MLTAADVNIERQQSDANATISENCQTLITLDSYTLTSILQLQWQQWQYTAAFVRTSVYNTHVNFKFTFDQH